MLYLPIGSNLHHKQMKRRCRDSKYIGCYKLKRIRSLILEIIILVEG